MTDTLVFKSTVLETDWKFDEPNNMVEEAGERIKNTDNCLIEPFFLYLAREYFSYLDPMAVNYRGDYRNVWKKLSIGKIELAIRDIERVLVDREYAKRLFPMSFGNLETLHGYYNGLVQIYKALVRTHKIFDDYKEVTGYPCKGLVWVQVESKND